MLSVGGIVVHGHRFHDAHRFSGSRAEAELEDHHPRGRRDFAVCIFLVTLVVRAQARRAVTGREGMIGELGTARTDLSPSGKVFVHGELWEAESDQPVRMGERVRVVEVEKNLKIKVKKEGT